MSYNGGLSLEAVIVVIKMNLQLRTARVTMGNSKRYNGNQ